MPPEALAATYRNPAVEKPAKFDDHLNLLMVDYMRDMVRAMDAAGIETMECYHSLLWDKEMVLDVLRQTALEFWSVHAPYGRFLDPSSPDKDIRDSSLAAFVDSIDVASRLGAKVVVAHPGAAVAYDVPKPERIPFVVEVIGRAADIAGVHGIKIGVEPLPKDEVGNSLEAVLEIIERIDRPNVGVNFDVNHLYPPERIPGLIRKAGSLIVSTHISDQDGVERHWLPFQGTLDWREVLSAFADAGYRGPLVYETHIMDASSCDEAAERIVENYNRLIELRPAALRQ
jgi:sugar phosphate isomerase/epimerase